jgi:hypothetical protein
MTLSTQEISDRLEIEQLLIRAMRSNGETEMSFQGVWYEDELVRTGDWPKDLKTGRAQLLSQHTTGLPVVIRLAWLQ